MKIIKTEIREESIEVELENGVVVHMAFNPDYIHMNFSFEEYLSIKPQLAAANIVNIDYKPRK